MRPGVSSEPRTAADHKPEKDQAVPKTLNERIPLAVLPPRDVQSEVGLSSELTPRKKFLAGAWP